VGFVSPKKISLGGPARNPLCGRPWTSVQFHTSNGLFKLVEELLQIQ